MDLNWNAPARAKRMVGCCAPSSRPWRWPFPPPCWRFTGWGLAGGWPGPYLTPRRSWRPLLTVALLLFLAMFAVRMTVLFSYWYNGFYSALQALIKGVLAFSRHLRHAGQRACGWLTAMPAGLRHPLARVAQRAPTHDLAGRPRLLSRPFLDQPVDNPDQRIEQDIGLFVAGTRTLAIGALSAVVSLGSSPLSCGACRGAGWRWREIARHGVHGLCVRRHRHRARRPAVRLIRLSFLSERLTANFRYARWAAREHRERGVLPGRGRGARRERFLAYVANLWARVYRGLKFDGFNLAVSQVAVAVPFLLRRRAFPARLKHGRHDADLAGLSGRCSDALSFFRTSYDTFAQYRATLDRLRLPGCQRGRARLAGRDRRGPRRAGAGWPERASDRTAGPWSTTWTCVFCRAGAADQGAVGQRQKTTRCARWPAWRAGCG